MTKGLYTRTHFLLQCTINFLAIQPEEIRERLKNSYDIFHPLNTQHFPEFLQERWGSVLQRMTRYGCVYDEEGNLLIGSVENTMRRIRKRTAARIAEDILDISNELSRYLNKKISKLEYEKVRDSMY